MAYNVKYLRDEAGWWVASVVEVPGCVTQGRSLRQARNRIREALGLYEDDADAAELIDHIELPKEARAAVKAQLEARKDLEHRQRSAQQAAERAAKILAKRLGFSVRDTAEVLGLSHQRIHQLVSAE